MVSVHSSAPPASSLLGYSPAHPSITSRRETCDLTGSVYLISSDGQTIKLPLPTRSPQDPLNWSARKRAGAFLALMIFAISGLTVVQGPSLFYEQLTKEFPPNETKPFSASLLLSIPTLFMGVGAFLWIPLSLAVGRRPVFLISTLTLLFSTIWAGVSGNFYSLLVALCFQGMAEGAATSVALLMIIDITFIHQRPQAIAMVWSLTGAISLSTLAVVPQMTNESTAWRQFYLIWIIPCFVSVILASFLYPETYFIRPAIAFDGRVIVQSATEKIKLYNTWEEVPGGKELPATPDESVWRKELRIWGTTRGGWKAMLACYPQFLLCLLNPLVFWVAFLEAVVFGSMLSIGETYFMVLTAEPYLLSVRSAALQNLAGAVGAFLAWPTSGILIARISRHLSMNNKGVRDAEYYLPAFILPILTGAASVIVYGLAVHFRWHWIWIYVSYLLNSFSFTGLAVANTLWVTEAFPRWAAPALMVVTGLSYIASFGISFAIIPWVKSQGYKGTNLQIAALILVVGCIGVPVSFWGKKLRQYIDGKWAISGMGALRPQ